MSVQNSLSQFDITLQKRNLAYEKFCAEMEELYQVEAYLKLTPEEERACAQGGGK